jgi:hypothetical protein
MAEAGRHPVWLASGSSGCLSINTDLPQRTPVEDYGVEISEGGSHVDGISADMGFHGKENRFDPL